MTIHWTSKILGPLFLIGVIVLIFGPGIYGLYLAFKASIILGIAVFIIQPSPSILGWIAIFGHPEVCQKLATWLHLPF